MYCGSPAMAIATSRPPTPMARTPREPAAQVWEPAINAPGMPKRWIGCETPLPGRPGRAFARRDMGQQRPPRTARNPQPPHWANLSAASPRLPAKTRDLIQSYLERAGFTVLSTGSDAEAISMAAAVPDLVVLALGCRMCPVRRLRASCARADRDADRQVRDQARHPVSCLQSDGGHARPRRAPRPNCPRCATRSCGRPACLATRRTWRPRR